MPGDHLDQCDTQLLKLLLIMQELMFVGRVAVDRPYRSEKGQGTPVRDRSRVLDPR